MERLRREGRQAKPEAQAQVCRLRRRQELREWLGRLTAQLRSEAPLDMGDEDLRRVWEFATQLQRALAGEDDELVERSARDLQAAWDQLDETFPGLAEGPEEAEGEEAAGATGPATVECANCEARLPPGFAFCGKCGMALKKDACAACGAALVEGFQFCGKCGARVEP